MEGGVSALYTDPNDAMKILWAKIDSYVVPGTTICDFNGIVMPRCNVQLDSFLDIFYPHIAGFNHSLDEERLYYQLLKEWFPLLRYLGDRYLDDPRYKIDWNLVREKKLLPMHGSFYFNEKVKIDQGDVVFDIGSAPGDFTATAICLGAGKVYAFEPSDAGIVKLDRLMKAFQPFEIVNSFAGKSIDEEKRCTTLDHFCIKNGIERINFIKMDVEGMENDVLIGAEQVIRDMQPKMAICTYHKPGDRKRLSETILGINPRYSIVYGRSVMYCHV